MRNFDLKVSEFHGLVRGAMFNPSDSDSCAKTNINSVACFVVDFYKMFSYRRETALRFAISD